MKCEMDEMEYDVWKNRQPYDARLSAVTRLEGSTLMSWYSLYTSWLYVYTIVTCLNVSAGSWWTG